MPMASQHFDFRRFRLDTISIWGFDLIVRSRDAVVPCPKIRTTSKAISMIDAGKFRILTSTARSATRQLVKKPRTVSRASSTTATAATTPATLTWPEYLAIKRNKRKWQMVRYRIDVTLLMES